jgi:hypothetical protein
VTDKLAGGFGKKPLKVIFTVGQVKPDSRAENPVRLGGKYIGKLPPAR